MPRVQFADVEMIAERIASENIEPTVDMVFHHLKTGSRTTLGKYLKTWKLKKLKTPDAPSISVDINELQEQLSEMQKESENLIDENIELSRENNRLQYELESSKNIVKSLGEEWEKLNKNLEVAEKGLELVEKERAAFSKTIVDEKNAQIASLEEELKSVHEMALEKVHEMSMSGQDKLIEEKILTKNQQVKLDEQAKLIKALKNRLAFFEKNQGLKPDPVDERRRALKESLNPIFGKKDDE